MRPPLMLLASSPLTLYDSPGNSLIQILARDGIGRIYQFVLKIHDEFTTDENLSIHVYRQDDDGKEWSTLWCRIYESDDPTAPQVYWNDEMELVDTSEVSFAAHSLDAMDTNSNELYHSSQEVYEGHKAWFLIQRDPVSYLQRVLTVAAL